MKSGVYFIKNENTGLIKIGCSSNIKQRFSQLQSQNAHLGYDNKLDMVNYILCEDYFKLERYLHDKYKKYRKINEWFDIVESDVKEIKENINSNDFKFKKVYDVLNNKTAIYEYNNGKYALIGYVNKDICFKLSMKLNSNEKLVFLIIRDFVQYPTNCVVIKDHIPTIKELEPIIGLTERSIITAIKSLETKNLLKRVQSGHKKAIYINPEYYASGKDLDIETLRLFNLIDFDDEKVESYL